MGRKERRQGTPELDPFGTNDPAWERYEGVSWLRRIAQSQAGRQGRSGYRPKRGEFMSTMLVGGLLFVGAIGAVLVVFWLISLVTE